MSSGFRILHLVRPFLSILPEVKRPDRKVRDRHGASPARLSFSDAEVVY